MNKLRKTEESGRFPVPMPVRAAIMAMVFGLTLSTPAWAHRVIIYGWVEGDRVITNSRFGNQRPVKGGDVSVFDAAGNLLTKGQTDDKGDFTFQVSGREALDILLSAGPGHQAKWRISAAELGAAENYPRAESIAAPAGSRVSAAVGGCSREMVEAVVDSALDRKLRPMMKAIAEAKQEAVSFRDILGGIGYILGLVGLATYIRFRPGKKVRE